MCRYGQDDFTVNETQSFSSHFPMMALRVFAYSLVFFFASVTPLATRSNLQACPLLGQQYPAPTKLRHEPKLQAAGKLIDAKLEKNVKTSPYNEFSFSVGMFSTTDDGLIYQYHHTSPGVKNSPFGTNEIDADSIYRVGSISKLLTAYLFLINEGDRRFNDPIVEYIPELKEYVANSTNGPTADWKAITVGDLLSALGGVTTDCKESMIRGSRSCWLTVITHRWLARSVNEH